MLARLRSEWAYLTGALRALRRVKPIARTPDRTWCDHVEELARRFPDRPALLSNAESYTFAAFDARANRYARWARARGITKGDCVALFMPNRPEYLAVWLGVARAGGVTALINTHLRHDALAHSLAIVEPKLAIVDEALLEAYRTADGLVESPPDVWILADGSVDEAAGKPLGTALDALSGAPLEPAEHTPLTINDRCLYIYTSGTTGLPKAANLNHYRVQAIMNGFSAAVDARPSDRIYICLPLYHSAGGVLGVGITLTVGGSVFIAERFSNAHFWDDVTDNGCTVFQYIGELCRYLLNAPAHPKERAHRLRIVDGNGLGADIWEAFQARFAIPRILEWYAATEGNAVLFNFDGKVGAIGRIPGWAKSIFSIEVVRFDPLTRRPERGPDGFCIRCEPDEAGEMIGEILDDPNKPSQRFDGYADAAETSRKIASDVFRRGDRWFRTGDLVRRDALGYFYFVDRVGDTFRWKGENVSTTEVAQILGSIPGVQEATVYGVEIPGRDGRAGMAALVVDDTFALASLPARLADLLPDYARPLFLRFRQTLETTSTLKQRKIDLVDDGYDPSRVDDPLFVADPATRGFVRIDPDLYSRVQTGALRL
ncbi:fatty-acyl-CoA synthase [Amorphus suaedae]